MKNKIYNSIFLGICTAVVAGTSYALITPDDTVPELDTISLPIPVIQPELVFVSDPSAFTSPVTSTNVTVAQPELETIAHNIKNGESLSSIFLKLGLTNTDLNKIIHTNEIGKQFISIVSGKKLIVSTDSNGLLQQLVYEKNSVDTLKATRIGDSFNIKKISKPIEKKIANIQTTINSSLFLDGKKAGLSDKTIMQLSEIFAWDIDFALNLRKNDLITVVYEKLFVEGKEIGTGNIISAEFVNQGQPYIAVRYVDNQGNARYFSPNGNSMRKPFLRSPVDFARISSHFNLRRRHPVLNKIRAHKGVDYAAKRGTPIKTTGDGKIIYRGRKGGYGRVVIVQHGKSYRTLYAHLSNYRRGQKIGSRIKQGQIIGYVGKSGLATGSHLHYEFQVNGIHRNPLTIELPHTAPIKKSLLAEFKQQTEPLIAQLNKVKASNLLAQNQL